MATTGSVVGEVEARARAGGIVCQTVKQDRAAGIHGEVTNESERAGLIEPAIGMDEQVARSAKRVGHGSALYRHVKSAAGKHCRTGAFETAVIDKDRCDGTVICFGINGSSAAANKACAAFGRECSTERIALIVKRDTPAAATTAGG